MMIKRFLLALVLGVFLATGCASVQPVADNGPEMPPHVQRIQDKSNDNLASQGAGVSITIKRWEDDGHTLWLWIDNSAQPEPCDYVVVLGIVDKATDQYRVLTIFNNKAIPAACSYAEVKYQEYLVLMKKAREDEKKKGGI
jgi:hypothetical protein